MDPTAVGQYVEKPRVYHGPRLFHIFSFFCHPGPVKRDFLHSRKTQPVPMEYHTKYYVFEVQRLVELNPILLVRHIERMTIFWMASL